MEFFLSSKLFLNVTVILISVVMKEIIGREVKDLILMRNGRFFPLS